MPNDYVYAIYLSFFCFQKRVEKSYNPQTRWPNNFDPQQLLHLVIGAAGLHFLYYDLYPFVFCKIENSLSSHVSLNCGSIRLNYFNRRLINN